MAPTTSSVPPAALHIAGLTKTFVGGRALDRVDLEIPAGEVHALLGENGSGKSTLIKVLSGYHSPDAGAQVSIGGAALEFASPHSSYLLGARFVHQDLGLVEDSSITDNLAFGPGFPTRFGTVRQREAAERAGAANLPISTLFTESNFPLCTLFTFIFKETLSVVPIKLVPEFVPELPVSCQAPGNVCQIGSPPDMVKTFPFTSIGNLIKVVGPEA